ncbi:MAG TPA: adenylosuccinate synthase [Bacteroidetes bacterium]|nr:adenylosuccinate synthase [Bacteroidota bacterium]
MNVDVIVGLQWGDEGKGKIVDYLAGNYGMVARFQGGPNAGHTIKIGEDQYVLHIMPSGIFHENLLNLIGSGVVIDPVVLTREIDQLLKIGINVQERLLISNKAHLILPTHKLIDAASESSKGKKKIGSTLKGIGPTYMDKTGRNGLRIGDIFLSNFKEKYNSLKEKHFKFINQFDNIPEFDIAKHEDDFFRDIEYLKGFKIINGEYFINDFLNSGNKVLAEGAQGTMLDINHGTYPYVTSSNTITAGVSVGLGIAPSRINRVIGIVKAYTTRVGSGPFPTELDDETGEKLRQIGHEFGATTGRKRRCGWIDVCQLNYSIMINGVTDIAFTKLDVLSDFNTIKMATSYKYPDGSLSKELPYDLVNIKVEPEYESMKGWNTDITEIRSIDNLPNDAIAYIKKLESYLNTPFSFISVGPERSALIVNE